MVTFLDLVNLCDMCLQDYVYKTSFRYVDFWLIYSRN